MRLWWGEWLNFLDDAKMLRGSAVWRVVGSLGTIRMIEDLDMLWWCVVGGSSCWFHAHLVGVQLFLRRDRFNCGIIGPMGV